MAKLQVSGKFDPLSRRNVAVGDKDHVGHWTSWKDCTTYKLADEIDRRVLIRDGHDDTNRNEEDRADAKSEKKTIPREMYGVAT